MKLHEEFGDTYMLPLGDVPLVVTRDPAHIRSLLGGAATETFPRPPNVIANIKILFDRAQIALDGEEHQANKRMLSDFLFSDGHNAMMSFPLQCIASDYLTRMEVESFVKGDAEAYYISELAAADISAALSFGRTYKALQTGQCPQLDALKRCDRIFLNRAMNKNWRETEPPEVTKEFNDSREIIAKTFLNAVDRLKDPSCPRDHNILQHMLERNAANTSPSCPMGQVPTVTEAVSNMIGFLAGVGNTARMMTLGIEMCARYPNHQQKILQELHMVLDGKSLEKSREAAEKGMAVPGARIKELYAYDNIMRLNYLRCFLLECLRLYTPSTSVAPRAATTPSPLGNFTIPAETKVMCNIYGAHRHPKYWKNPEEFNPMRFNEGKSDSLSDIKVRGFVEEGFFPFGYGGHSCIGKAIAMECTLICWSMAIGIHQISRTPGFKDAEFNTLKSDQILGFIEAQNGVHVTLHARPVDKVAEAFAPQRILNMSEEAYKSYLKRIEQDKRSANVNREKKISMEEVMKHNTNDSVWFVIDGKVYDATPWLRDHPGMLFCILHFFLLKCYLHTHIYIHEKLTRTQQN
jgi:cytochrome P450